MNTWADTFFEFFLLAARKAASECFRLAIINFKRHEDGYRGCGERQANRHRVDGKSDKESEWASRNRMKRYRRPTMKSVRLLCDCVGEMAKVQRFTVKCRIWCVVCSVSCECAQVLHVCISVFSALLLEFT